MAATIDDLLAEMRLVRKGQDSENDEARGQAKRERALLGQSEKQYEATLAQRKVTESSQKELQDLESILGGDAKNNKQYQKAEAKLEKEKMRMTKLENRRNLLSRFKDDPKGVIKDTGSKLVEGTKNTFGKLFGFLKKFGALFSLLVLPALLLLVNSPVWGILKQKVKDLIEWFGKPDNPIVNFFNDIIKGNFLKAFDDAITRAIKAAFGVEFEGSVVSVIKRFIGDFLAGLANLLPDFDEFAGAKAALLKAAADLDPKRKAERLEQAAAIEDDRDTSKEKKLRDSQFTRTQDINFQNKELEEAVEKKAKLEKEIAKIKSDMADKTGKQKKLAENKLDIRETKLKETQKEEQKIREELNRLQKEQKKVEVTLDDVTSRTGRLQAEAGVLGIDDLDETQITSGGITGMKRTSQMLNSRLIRKQIKAAGGQQIERAGGDQDSIKELASEVGKNTDELRRQREALAEAKGDANKKPPAPIVIDGSVSSVITSPTNMALSSPRQVKQDGTAGVLARGAGSVVGTNP